MLTDICRQWCPRAAPHAARLATVTVTKWPHGKSQMKFLARDPFSGPGGPNWRNRVFGHVSPARFWLRFQACQKAAVQEDSGKVSGRAMIKAMGWAQELKMDHGPLSLSETGLFQLKTKTSVNKNSSDGSKIEDRRLSGDFWCKFSIHLNTDSSCLHVHACMYMYVCTRMCVSSL